MTQAPGNITGRMTRRQFVRLTTAGVLMGGAAVGGSVWLNSNPVQAATFIARVPDYRADIRRHILDGLDELGMDAAAVTGKRVLLKPNLVEPHRMSSHINTHPLVVRGAVEAFLHLGASEVVVAEGSGHRRDTILVLEESGFTDVLADDRIPFIDLNRSDVFVMPNKGERAPLRSFLLPTVLGRADIIVSMAKMKTHHWVGATLSMKNLFGVLPGDYYGWPKNVLHVAGIPACIYDITATVQPHLAIVDGIVGMEGDGPIMGSPVSVGVLVMGRNLPAVDATSARVMGIDPLKIPYLAAAGDTLGPVRDALISQRGETISSVARPFRLIGDIPAHKDLRP